MNLRVLQIRRRLHHHAALFAPHRTIAVKAGEIRALLAELDELEVCLQITQRQRDAALVATAEKRLGQILAPEAEEPFILRN